MEPTDLVLPPFDVPAAADAPALAPEAYARWIRENVQRLRETGRLDELCAARSPVNVRFKFPAAH